MISALLLAAVLPQATTVTLYRGAPLATPGYWDVRDSYLDAKEPEANFGGAYTLLGGQGRTILIRFGDLNRAIGPNRRIVKASLQLSAVGGDAPALRSVSRVLAPWGEGPMLSLRSVFRGGADAETTKVVPPTWSSTYRFRRSPSTAWQQPGATGVSDSIKIDGTSASVDGGKVTITGLEGAVQTMVDRPQGNQGFALLFDSATEFNSSQSASGKPTLLLEVEDAPAKQGPDLSVTLIERTPDGAPDGTEVTYRAHVKNMGDAPSKAYAGQWVIGESVGSSFDAPGPLAAGAEAIFELKRSPKANRADHRIQPIAFRVSPAGDDAVAGNNELEIQENGLPVTLTLPSSFANLLAREANDLGTHSIEDWAQGQVKLFNDTYCAQSHFSFALEGALERVRLAAIKVTDDAPPVADSARGASLAIMRQIALQAALDDGSSMSVGAGRMQIAGASPRSSPDRFPGLMGYGDTRFEGQVPTAIELPYEPTYNPVFESLPLEPTGLLAATEVGALNTFIAKRPSTSAETYLPMPRTTLIRVTDLLGRPINGASLEFIRPDGGVFKGGAPSFTAMTSDGGTAILSSRGAYGPFGEVGPNAAGGVLLVAAKLNGVTEYGFLKAWQLTDAARRGSVAASIFDLHLNLPAAPIDRTVNLASDRIITDSAADFPAQLSPLIDDDDSTEANLPEAVGGWVEIDLGRDRSIAEISLIVSGKPFWDRFDIRAYATGQRPEDAITLARELDWSWTSANRSDLGTAAGTHLVSYRPSIQRVRFIRLVNRAGGAGRLAGIKISPVAVP